MGGPSHRALVRARRYAARRTQRQHTASACRSGLARWATAAHAAACFVVFTTGQAVVEERGRRVASPRLSNVFFALLVLNIKSNRRFLDTYAIALVTACLIALTWLSAMQAAHGAWQKKAATVKSTLANRALALTTEIDRQILVLDQTLRTIVMAYEGAPRSFNLVAWQDQAVALNGLSRDMVLADERGIFRKSSVAEIINQNVSGASYFVALSKQEDPVGRTFVGSASAGPILRQWHMNVARARHRPNGSFACVVDVDYRTASVTALFGHDELGPDGFGGVVDLNDGKLRGAGSPGSIEPDTAIGGTPMFKEIRCASNGIWIGPSPVDAVIRVHAFRYLSDRALAVTVAMDQDDAMRPATIWRQQVNLFAGCITILLTGMGLLLVRSARVAQRREAALAEEESGGGICERGAGSRPLHRDCQSGAA